jgi:hypothetical protein
MYQVSQEPPFLYRGKGLVMAAKAYPMTAMTAAFSRRSCSVEEA